MEETPKPIHGAMECTLSNVGHLISLLSTLQQSHSSFPYNSYETRDASITYLYIIMSKEGIKFRTVSKGRDVYADIWFAASFFGEYRLKTRDLNHSSLRCMVSLQSLLHSLMIFGLQAHLKWVYSERDGVITLLLQEETDRVPHISRFGVSKSVDGISECILKTLDMEGEEYLPDIRKELFCSTDSTSPSKSNKVDFFCMLPSIIREVLLDFNEDDEDGKVVMALEPRGPTIEEPVLYIGMAQQVTANQWDFQYHPVLFPQFAITRSHKNFYKLRSLLLVTSALKIAHGLKIDISDSGALALQLIIKADVSTLLYINFYLFPTDPDSD